LHQPAALTFPMPETTMPPVAPAAGRKPVGPGRAILLGGLVVGVLDGLDAVVFFGLRGVAPIRIFQHIASGALGRASFTGGLRTALLGVAFHFFIATAIVTVYYAASRAIGLLTRQPVACGIAYGLLVYAFMNLVVVPLSAASQGPPTLPVLVNGLLIHALGVGVPSALVARWGRRPAAH
jgi:hypothetical protein